MDAFRQSWLHVLLHSSCDNVSDLKTGNLNLDKILQIIGDNSKEEFGGLDNELRMLLGQLHATSFLSTLSTQEIATFYGMLGAEEEELLLHITKEITSQNLRSDDVLANFLTAAGHSGGVCFDNIAELSAILPFVRRTEVLLSMGGDDRLTINFHSDKLNKYLSSTIPRSGMINRGSCTCSTITMENYLLADRVRSQFVLSVLKAAADNADPERVQTATKKVFQSQQSQLLSKLRKVLGFSPNEDDAQVVLFPSGSDAEYLPLIAALVHSHTLAQGHASKIRVINYVCAAGEVGSGTAAAAGGRHFSALTPRGDNQHTVNSLLEGLQTDWVRVVQFKPRDGTTGAVRSQEDEIVRSVRSDLGACDTAVAVVHVVCGSKTGLVHPSFDVVAKLQSEFGERVVVVVDACQLRCDLRHLKRYTDAGYLTLVTGSKFFTGPPFAGAVIVPNRIAQQIEAHIAETFHQSTEKVCVVPTGLRSYLTPFEVPLGMPHLRALLAEDNNWLNFGLHLRWACCIDVMARYAALPSDRVQKFTRLWAHRVRELIAQQSPFLRVLPGPEETDVETAETMTAVSGIVSVVVSVADLEALEERAASDGNNFLIPGFGQYVNGKKVTLPVAPAALSTPLPTPMCLLNFDQLKDFHRLMTLQDAHVADTHSAVLVQPSVPVRCMLGQPVKLADNGFAVVRIALGADMVLQALEHSSEDEENEEIEVILRQDDAVVTKMALLAKNWHTRHANLSTTDHVHKSAAINQTVLIPQAPFPSSAASCVGTTTVTTAATVSRVLKQVFSGTAPVPDVAIFYDLDALTANVHALKRDFAAAFPAGIQFTHCFAVKAAPMTFLLQHMASLDLGMETASIMEVKQALRVSAPHKVVFDSPCKTLTEIEFSLRRGVTINADSYAEVKKIATALKTLAKERVRSSSNIGLRVNPMVGAGAIAALSTATGTSKFGVPSSYADQDVNNTLPEGVVDLREQVIQTFLQYPFLTGIMCHVGSQGMAVELMVQGAQHILQLADEIDLRLAQGNTDRRISYVDIGGGLSANYGSDEVVYTFAEYATKLAQVCGDTLRRAPHRRIVTEFGKAIITKSGVIATRVEEAAEQEALRSSTVATDAADLVVSHVKNVTAVVHAGADLLLRTAYCPDKFSHRIVLLDEHKQLLQAATEPVQLTETADPWSLSPSPIRPLANVTIAGPLCFSGDVLGRNLPLPEPRAGDICLLLDAGANTLSLFSRHCSRLSPAVYAFRKVSVVVPAIGTGELRVGEAKSAETNECDDVYLVACIRERESEAELLSFWG